MNSEELLKIIKLGETSKVQFKRKFDNQEKIAAEMIAFANSKRRLTDNSEIMRLFQESGILLADEMEVYGTSIDDIDERLFAAYFKKEFQRSYQDMGLTYEKALKAKRVMRNNRITLAGLLFFGVEPQIIKLAFTIKTVSYVGNESSGIHYRSKPADLKGTVPELFKQAMMFLASNLRHIQQGQGFNSVGVLEISQIVLEEIVQNALMHRDYFKNAPVRIFIFDNRVEICSPGKLPENLTVEELGFGNPVIRNNQIVAFGIHTLPFSGLGTGLKRSLEIEPDIELINDEAGEQFIVRIPRRKLDTSDENIATSEDANIASSGINIATSGANIASSEGNIATSDANIATSEDTNIASSGINIATSDANIASSKGNIATSGANIASSEDTNIATSDTKRISREDLENIIIKASEDYIALEELARTIGKSLGYLKDKILPKLIKEGKLERLYPTIPNHPRQKYKAKQQ